MRASLCFDQEPTPLVRPADIHYGDWKPDADAFRFNGVVSGLYRAEFPCPAQAWIVENGVAEPYEGPWSDH